MIMLRFVIVGIANTTIGLLLIWACMFAFQLDAVISNSIGYGAGLILSFFLNRSWTFSDTAPARRSLPKWLLTAAVAFPANLAIVVLATRYFALNPYFAQLLGVAVYSTIMFLGSRYFVFRCTDQTRGASNEAEPSTDLEHCRSMLQ